jgi:hypothetical protein
MRTFYTVADLIKYLQTLSKDTEIKLETPSGNLMDGIDVEYENDNLIICDVW